MLSNNILSIVSHPQFNRNQTLDTQAKNVRLLNFVERIFATTRCPNHAWSWPVTLRRPRHADSTAPMPYPEGYHAHQVCTTCGVQRFYNPETFEPGAMFFKSPPEPKRA
jgi:hypothetical protein